MTGGELWTVTLAGGVPVRLVANTGHEIAHLYLAGDALYWCSSVASSGSGALASPWKSIMRLDLNAPHATPSAAVDDPLMQAIAATDGSYIYWSTSSCPPHAGTCIRRKRLR